MGDAELVVQMRQPGVELQGAPKGRHGLGKLALLDQHRAQIAVNRGKSGLRLQRTPVVEYSIV